jgi:hypothetical protein
VYYNGEEIMPNQQRLIQGLSIPQTKTLTIKCISTGQTTLSANWDIYTNPRASGIVHRFGTWSSDSLDLTIMGAKILTDTPVMSVHEDGYNDLVEAELSVLGLLPQASGEMQGRLSASGDIRVWADPERTIPIIAGDVHSATWDLFGFNLPKIVYIEGLAPGNAHLFWTVVANGKDLNSNIVDFTVIKLDALTVTERANPNNTVTVTTNIPKTLYVAEDKYGNINVDIKAIFEQSSAGKYVHWTIIQGGKTIEGTFANGTTISSKNLKAADGDLTVKVYFGDGIQILYNLLTVNVSTLNAMPKYDFVGYGGETPINGWGHPNDYVYGKYGVSGKFYNNNTSFGSSVWMCGGGVCNTPSFTPPPPDLAGEMTDATGSGSFIIFVSNLAAGDYEIAIHYCVLVATTASVGGASGNVSYWGQNSNGIYGWISEDFAVNSPAGDSIDYIEETVVAHVTVAIDGQRVKIAKYLLNSMTQALGNVKSNTTKATSVIDIISAHRIS